MTDRARQVVLVTGATGGLGEVVTRAFAGAGARLVVTARRAEALHEAFPELVADPAVARAVPADLGDPRAVDALVAAALDAFGRLDVVVHLAGAFRGGRPLAETPVEEIDTLWSVNARSAFLVARAAAAVMVRQGSGRMVFVASRSAHAGSAGVAPYSASKAAVLRLTESLAAELGPHGVHVNCIVPGTIDTAANRAASPDADTAGWVQPEAIADLLLFLASDASRAVHGAAVPVVGIGVADRAADRARRPPRERGGRG